MYPSSPKGTDLRLDGRYALHTAVEDNEGGGGEFHVRGYARPVDSAVYAAELEKAGFPARDGDVLFELLLDEASAITDEGNGEPRRQKWKRATDRA